MQFISINLFKSSISILVLSIFLTACANNPFRSYKAETDTLIYQVNQGRIKPAITKLSQNKTDIMSHFEAGSLYRMDDNYQSSIASLNFINTYINIWLASFHNSKLGAAGDVLQAGLINDKAIDYQVKDYEKVMLSTYLALNNISLNQPDYARIEIKRMYQIEDRIKNYRSLQYAKEQNQHGAPTYQQFQAKSARNYNFAYLNSASVLQLKNSYENAFSHYLAGFIFESLGENSLARPGYLRALELNPNNRLIKTSIKNLDDGANSTPASTNLLIIEEVGHAPQLQSQSFTLPWVQTLNNNTCVIALKFSLPRLVPDNIDHMVSFNLDGKASLTPSFMTDINLMAARYLHDNLPNLFTSNIVRAVRDYTLQGGACNNSGTLADIALAGLGQFLNNADERTWVMLPAQIYVSRIELPRGSHVLTVNNHQTKIYLNRPYQVVSFRVMGNQVYFSK